MAARPNTRKTRGPAKKHTAGEDVKHIVKTGLPPGIGSDELWDPGNAARKRAGSAQNKKSSH
jgi:hypothetical protein